MGKDKTKNKLWFAIALAVVGIVILAGTIVSSKRSRAPVPSELMPELSLPSDPVEAEQIVKDRALRDAFRGIDEATREKRHEKRLEQLEQIKENAQVEDNP